MKRLTFVLCLVCTLAISSAAHADSAVTLSWQVHDPGPNFYATVTPVPVSGLDSGVTAVAAGFQYSLAVQNGGAFAWGRNIYGQLGDGTTTRRLTPVPVSGLASGVTAVAANARNPGVPHSLAVQNGALYAWGLGSLLGDGVTGGIRSTPGAVSGMESGVTAIAAGNIHSLAVKDGGLYGWGQNGSGNLGDGTTTQRLIPVPVIGLASGVTAISAGDSFSLAVKDGGVYAWGQNFFGELGDGTTTDRSIPAPVTGLSSGATAVAAGRYHSLAVVNGTVYAWGTDYNGGFGDGFHTVSSTIPLQVDPANLTNIIAVAIESPQFLHNYALSSDGSLWSWGNLTYGIPQHVLPPVGYKFTSIAAGSNHALATLAVIPEPNTLLLALAATGVFSVIGCSRRRRNFSTFSRSVNQSRVNARHTIGTTLLSMFTIVSAASAAPLYHITTLGLDDPEHTRNDGYKTSYTGQLNEAGQVGGTSLRYNSGSTDLGRTAWLYDGASTFDIGLVGSEHTRNDGYKYSVAEQLNEAGKVRGTSYRYNSGSTDLGRTAWLYDGATTIDIGLTVSEHTRNDGYKYSNANYLNETGQVSGYSYRYNGGIISLGASAWLYDGATTIDVGLTGAEHTKSDGYKYSNSTGLNEAGQVAGLSLRYNGGGADLGRSAWLYDGATTIELGFTGPEYTRSDGYKSSYADSLNEAGQVIGESNRYNGGSAFFWGYSAWLYDGTTTIELGLTGPEHTRSDGYKFNGASALNDAGQVVGGSTRYGSGEPADLGYSAWLYDGANTIELGLTGPEYTRNDGYKSSTANYLNESGQVVGISNRYIVGVTNNLSHIAWLYSGATTIDIGLTGNEHTRNDGYKDSHPIRLNRSGQVVGKSSRFNSASTYLGESAWLYDGATTIDVGLTGPEYTRNDGYKSSEAAFLNEAGQVAGFARRYSGGAELGQDAWLYDPVLDQTFTLQLSVTGDGYANSTVVYLGDDGLVLGRYFPLNLGYRAFYFTVADGLHDLGSLVDGGLAANGWDYLASAIRANGLGQILGSGKLTSPPGGQMAYLLTPAIPEPSTFLLAAAALGLCLAQRRRRAQNRVVAPLLAFSVCIAALLGLPAPSARADSVVPVGSSGLPVPGGLDSGVTAVAAGAQYSLAVQNGGAYAWGTNDDGQLGDGTTTFRSTPVPVIGLASGVTAVAANARSAEISHSLAVQNGALYAWGRRFLLGDGTTGGFRSTPGAVTGMDSGVTAVAAGYRHSLAVKDGALYGWGQNFSGILGDGTTTQRLTPVAVIGMDSGVTAVAAGSQHSLAVKDGGVYAWGANNVGQLGNGTFGSFSSIPALVGGLSSGATAVAAGEDYSFAVVNGRVYAWGQSSNGSLGNGSGFPSAFPILVDPTNVTNIIAVAAGGPQHNENFALSSDGSLWIWNGFPQHQLPPASYKFTSISAGSDHALATLAAIPEPNTLLLSLAATGVFSFLGCSRRRRNFSTFSRSVNQSRVNARHTIGTTLLSMFTIVSAASAAPLYHITTLGFDDPEHTSSDGIKLSFASQPNELGQVTGSSYRFNGGSTLLGSSAWLYNGTTTIELGFTGPEYTRDNGYKNSGVAEMNQAGQVLGLSERYLGSYSYDPGYSVWLYNGTTTIELGFTGPEYTSSRGFRYSRGYSLNEAGQVAGWSQRYNNGGGGVGAWLYNGTTTIELGCTGPEYTGNDGYKFSSPNTGPNEAGQVSGYSQRMSGGGGRSAWLYNGATTLDIGLTGPEHTRNDGYRYSSPARPNEAGQVSGTSTRYNGGSTDLGSTAWLYDGAATTDIGLTGAEHTRNDGYRSSFPFADGLNEAGQVIGISRRYNDGSADLGRTAWLYNGATTTEIGLTGSEHTRNDGYKRSQFAFVDRPLNKAGQVLGYSNRYNGGSTQLGQSLWLYDGATTIDIGLSGPEQTRNDGYKYSNVFDNIVNNGPNEAGQVLGYSELYNGGSTQLGQSVWLYNGTTTIDIGLTGPEYTGSGGSKYSEARAWNEAGQVSGYSYRYNGGSTDLGSTAWLYDGTTTIELGFTGSEYTRSDGFRASSAGGPNEAGQVTGYSQRFSGRTSLGQDAWFYDPTLHQTIPLRLSTRSDGYAFSSAYVAEDGVVWGFYTLFDALDNELGSRDFYFTIADGLHDLGSLVDGGLTANGWDYLGSYGYGSYPSANGHGQITGVGKLTSQSGGQIAYLLTPAVPEPSTCLLALAALGLCIARRRRRASKDNPNAARQTRRRQQLSIALGLSVTLCNSAATARAATLRTVALSGQQVPGAPDGTVFRSFNGRSLVLNDAGQTAFQGNASDSNFGGIWSEGAGSLELVAAEGQQAPGMPDGVTYAGFPSHILRIVINDASSTAFSGSSTGGLGFWSSGAGGSALIARSGEQAAGTPAGVVYSIWDGGGITSLVMNNVGQTAFWAELSGTGVDYGVWAQRHGGLELVARTGNHAPGMPDGVNFGQIWLPGGPALNGLGQTAFVAPLTGPGVDDTNYAGIWSEASGSLSLVVRTGGQAPGMPDGAVFTGVGAFELTLNAAGQTAFHGVVTGGGVDSTNDLGIWSEASGSLALVVRSGTPAPGTPSGVNFRHFADSTPPALNDTGQIAFQAGLAGAGVDSTNDLGFWSGAPGSLALVARTGDHAPGTEDGVVFRDFRFGSALSPLILNAAGQTAFVARLTGSGIIASNDFGIWATDHSGALQLIAREGDPLEVAAGDFRTISILTFRADPYNLSTGNSDGRPSFFNNLGQLAFQATFTDGTSGIFVSNRVAIPEPSTFLLAAVAFAGLLLPRRAVGSRERRTLIIANHRLVG